ncbi:MAG TPA: hypothetical protein VLM85_20015 [Polyangiaceae bacterium]|nr:hypothetical protein [Polyangiaceae bacterium]
MEARASRVLGGLAGVATVLVAVAALAAPVSVRAPMVCSRGPSGTTFNAIVTVPSSQAAGTTYTTRIESTPSGKIDHGGLNYIHDMQTDYLIPPGTSYVEGSAHVVPGTGTANVRAGARVTYQAGTIRLLLPAHVPNGGSYTPPTIEFDVRIPAGATGNLPLKFSHYEVKANAIIIGDLVTRCDPDPKPYTIAVTRVEPAPPAPAP